MKKIGMKKISALVLGCLLIHSTVLGMKNGVLRRLAIYHGLYKPECPKELPGQKKYGELTIDQAAYKIYHKTMTNDEFRTLAVGLLQDRIDFWFQELKNGKKIPSPYIMFNEPSDIKADGLIKECLLKNDFETYTHYKKINNCSYQNYSYWYQMLVYAINRLWPEYRIRGATYHTKVNFQGINGILLKPTIVCNTDYSSSIIKFFHTLLHELRHVEQGQDLNYILLEKALGSEILGKDYKILNKFEKEAEADMVPFMHNFNPLLFTKLPHYARPTEEGYLSIRQTTKIALEQSDAFYKKYPEKKELDEKQVKLWSEDFPDYTQEYKTAKPYIIFGIIFIIEVIAIKILLETIHD